MKENINLLYMKYSLSIVRWIVGVLFIISGLVKLNDPIGLSYKMQEFFEVWNFHFLNDYALLFSVVLNVFEVFAGAAILIGWRTKNVSWLLLLLIVFFTILTGYAYLSGKIKSCGCFGDCLPITAQQSFYKDLFLLMLIVYLVIYPYQLKETIYPLMSKLVLTAIVLAGFFIQWHVLNHLPLVDCLPFKKGKHILQQMKTPAGAIEDSFAIEFIYIKNGQQIHFNQDQFPADFDSTYEYVGRNDVLIKKGNGLKAAITDFSLFTHNRVDTTLAILQSTHKIVLLLVQDANDINLWESSFESVQKYAAKLGVPLFIVSAEADKLQPHFVNTPILSCDATVLKTAARVKPTYFLLQGDLILDKKSYLDVDQLFQ